MTHTERFLDETRMIAGSLDHSIIEAMADELASLRKREGRLFFIGNGGSAANASHAVNDFRKIAGIEAYTPTDNVAELTARINDDGWDTAFENWLIGSHLSTNDTVFVLSVGGGSKEVSLNVIEAMLYASSAQCTILGIVGRNGGMTAELTDLCIIIPTVNEATVTPHVESFQSVILHLLVTHPLLTL